MFLDVYKRQPLYSGDIRGIGPRYCPSIEDKVVRFADKERHQVFLEPEGDHTCEYYVSGMSSSLPEDVQRDMLRTLPGLEHVQIMRTGYAIEYDCIDPLALDHTLPVSYTHLFEGRCNRIELRFFLVVVVVGAVDLGISGRKANEC